MVKSIDWQGTSTLSPIRLPEIPRATAEEVERRRALFAETMALREEIGPIGADVAELIRELRDGDNDSQR